MSIAKYLPPLFAAQIPSEDLQGAENIAGMPIPPMLEEGMSLEELQVLAERRDDDLCDLGSSSSEEMERMQMATIHCQEYAQLYAHALSQTTQLPKARPKPLPKEAMPKEATPKEAAFAETTTTPIDELDADDLLLQTLSERQKLAEVGKLVGMARYALEGQDTALLKDTKQRIERLTRSLPDKYRGAEIEKAATDPSARGARLAELYLSRAYKLLDEEYAEIPRIESAIRNLKDE
jgi:ribosomal protein S18 acetylase RimI-like enzyme